MGNFNRLAATTAVILVGCSENGAFEVPENEAFCSAAENLGVVVTNQCRASDALPHPDESYEEGGSQAVEIWLIQTYGDQHDIVQVAEVDCVNHENWDAIDCDEFALCVTDRGLVFPEEFPASPDGVVETQCGPIVVEGPQPDND